MVHLVKGIIYLSNTSGSGNGNQVLRFLMLPKDNLANINLHIF